MLLLPYISHTRVRSTNTTIYKPAFQIIVVSITYPLNNAILTVDKVDLHYNTPPSLLSVSIVVVKQLRSGPQFQSKPVIVSDTLP